MISNSGPIWDPSWIEPSPDPPSDRVLVPELSFSDPVLMLEFPVKFHNRRKKESQAGNTGVQITVTCNQKM